jgi:hypothetical protein
MTWIPACLESRYPKFFGSDDESYHEHPLTVVGVAEYNRSGSTGCSMACRLPLAWLQRNRLVIAAMDGGSMKRVGIYQWRTTVGELVESLTEEIENLFWLKPREKHLLVAYLLNDILARRGPADRGAAKGRAI